MKEALFGNDNLESDFMFLKIHIEAFKLALKEIIIENNGEESVKKVISYLSKFKEE